MEIISGEIIAYDGKEFTIRAQYTDYDRASLREYKHVEIGLHDGRTITPDQRRKIFALIEEITNFYGEQKEKVKQLMKIEFSLGRMDEIQRKVFSLSTCDVTLARDFISYLIDFAVENNIPTKVPLIQLSDDVEKYIYARLLHKTCAICGKKADLHHVDKVGMGRDRKTIIHEGLLAMPLCRIHHTECHSMPQSDFDYIYKLISIKLDKKLCRVYGVKYEST